MIVKTDYETDGSFYNTTPGPVLGRGHGGGRGVAVDGVQGGGGEAGVGRQQASASKSSIRRPKVRNYIMKDRRL